MITVLIVDDHAMVRDGLVAVLDAEDDLSVVGAAGRRSERSAPAAVRSSG
jgi:DNA-binding NarL/FixJ family response regulator